MSEWQPIEAAPNDGRDLLLTSPVWFGDALIGGFHFGSWRVRPDPKAQVLDPTHFMLIPPLDVEFGVSPDGEVSISKPPEVSP